ncbi:MAG: glycosyltransferase family 2 protein [Candidatus Kapabacteria bacterium]|nr:glycosyltransferase family 2 protein [Candidatus Kapabacteria bacterium]
MLIELIIYVSIFFQSLIVITVTINAIFGPFLKKGIKKQDELKSKKTKVSILVPARNEEKNIENCLNSITSFDYPDYEIIVLDDGSTDNTYKILETYQSKHPNLKILKGKQTPYDWLGKNWACYQLAQEAKGDILIFTDADNWHRSDALTETIEYMNRYRLDFLSAFPQQITKSLSEKIFVPVVDLIIYSFLILWSTLLMKSSIFAAANGQWIAIRREAYFKIGGHSAVKSSIVEDIQLSRVFKKNSFRTLTTAGTDIVFGRMYHNFSEIWNGFSKNMYFIFGGNFFILFGIIFLLLLTGIFPYISLFFTTSFLFPIISISLIILWRAILSLRFKSNLFLNVIFHPISILFLILIALNSFIKIKTGKIEWKGRKIKVR